MSKTASKMGREFENFVYENIRQIIPKYIVRREQDVKDDYGKDISAVDIEIFKDIKVKDIGKEKNTHIFIQCKWKDSSEQSSSVNHFIHCCNQIINMKKLKDDECHCFYVTKCPITKVSQEALDKLKNGKNIYDENMDFCIKDIIKNISNCLNIKLPKQISVEIPIDDGNLNYEELKKIQLVMMAMKEFNINKSTANKFKHSELVKMLKDKKQTETNDSCDDTIQNTNFMTVEYDEPNNRCPGEMKSKLLKPGSDLYNFITKIKNYLRTNGYPHQDRMGLHSEVLNDNSESLETFLKRVDDLEGRKIDVKNFENYDVVGRAVVLLLGDLEEYNKDAKITIAYFGDVDKAEQAIKIVEKYINS